MINNEFNLIGIVVGNYVKDPYGNYTLRVEVEKMGSREGNVFDAEVKVYGTNRIVDTSRLLLGEQVAVNGYVDFFRSKKGVPVLRLVAQRVYVLGEQRKKIDRAKASYGPSPENLDMSQDESEAPIASLDEADLPF